MITMRALRSAAPLARTMNLHLKALSGKDYAGAIQATTAWTVFRGRLAEADILLACLITWATPCTA